MKFCLLIVVHVLSIYYSTENCDQRKKHHLRIFDTRQYVISTFAALFSCRKITMMLKSSSSSSLSGNMACWLPLAISQYVLTLPTVLAILSADSCGTSAVSTFNRITLRPTSHLRWYRARLCRTTLSRDKIKLQLIRHY